MMKKLENSEFQSISIIFPREEATCLEHLQVLHLGGGGRGGPLWYESKLSLKTHKILYNQPMLLEKLEHLPS
jgi:hypothetical protein